jgi:hypothetical protein
VIAALKGLPANPLAQYFSATAGAVPAADLSRPAPPPTLPVRDSVEPE